VIDNFNTETNQQQQRKRNSDPVVALSYHINQPC